MSLPREEPRPKAPRGLGMPPLADRLLGLLLLPEKRPCVGDVGDLMDSAVLGRADRLSGWVPSSYRTREKYKTGGQGNREQIGR